MRVAIFGATGFIGYDFTRLLLEETEVVPVVYSTSAKNLTNISRHDIPLHLVSYRDLARQGVDAEVDVIVNFAHAFGVRDGLLPQKQIQILASALTNALEKNKDLRLIHISSMSVYEPFAPGKAFAETETLNPPSTDPYASSKVHFEQHLSKNSSHAERTMYLRPTIVYGPFCRPWTDGPMSAFFAGDVFHTSLDGRLQPLYVRDLSRFLWRAIHEFKPGVLNIAGNQQVTWRTFLDYFAGIVNNGKLIPVSASFSTQRDPTTLEDLKSVIKTVFNDRAFQRLVMPITRFVPAHSRDRLLTKVNRAAPKMASAKNEAMPFVRPFFGEDRLVSTERFQELYPDFRFTDLEATREELSRYMLFRFTNTLMGP